MGGVSLNILVSGMLAGVPNQGGASWAVLQYLLGLQRLDHQVFFLEPVTAPTYGGTEVPLSKTRAAKYFSRILEDFNLRGAAALVDFRRKESIGRPYEDLKELFRNSDLLINLAGSLELDSDSIRIPNRIYVDIDPVFTQLWHEQCLNLHLEGHSCFVTIGLNLGSVECPVPTLGFDWRKTLQPVVLSSWNCSTPPGPSYTTIANWRSYGSVEAGGVCYGQKVHSWRRLLQLPRITEKSFQVALAIDPAEDEDLKALREGGWELLNPQEMVFDPASYREFISRSRGEIGIAKSGYVVSRCGWFSERSACYLAMGRPVIAQDTGFSSLLPCGRGLLTFTSLEEAAQAISDVEGDYLSHAKAAREIAREYFDSDRVLTRLLESVGVEG